MLDRTIAIRSFAVLTLAAALSFSPAFPEKVARAARGEILGIVEAGGSRVEGAVVSLSGVSGSYAPPSRSVAMNQKEKQFLPHVLAVMKGTTVRFDNGDPFFHNVFSSSRVKTFNVSQEKKGEYSEITFDKIGLVPIRCHIHAAMKAYIVVLPNPFFDTTNEKGLFRISDVPAGTYTIKVWSEKGTASQSITVSSGERTKVILKASE